MIGAMLGAITGLIGAGLQASSQAAQQQIAWAQLQYQKNRDRQQQRFAQAARTDAFGNKQSYDDILNEWIIALTPTQKQITQAGEKEQLLSLTEDAPRARRQRARMEENAKAAGKEYEKALAGYKYDQPASEGAIRDELEKLILGGRQQQMHDDQGIIARQALRMGKGADIAKIIKATDDQYGQILPQLMLQAREGARNERSQRLAQHSQQYMPEMQMWQQIMQNGGQDGNIRFSDTPEKLMAQQGQMASAIQSAMQSGASSIGQAYSALGTAMGKSPDLSGVAGSLGKLDGGSGSAGRGSSGATKYSMTMKAAANRNNPDEHRQPWDAGLDWGSTGDYLNNMDYGDWLF